MDIWEANEYATSIAPHNCNATGLYACNGTECSYDGVCDEWGCGYNPYVLGNHQYYGPGLKVDTSRTVTVVTQFPAVNGVLTEIRRLYIQDGRIIANAAVNTTGTASANSTAVNSITDAYCTNPGNPRFEDLGGLPAMGKALSRGMVLIFSIWWDVGGYMNWLDSGNAGPCNATEGNTDVIRIVQPDPTVTFSQIKWGEIGSTYSARGPRGY